MSTAASSASSMGGKAAIGLVGLAVGLVAGYGAGRVSTGTPINPITGQPSSSYEQGYQAAMKKVAESGFLPQAPAESTTLEGNVKAVGESRLTLEADLQAFDPLGLKNLPKERTVTVTGTTELVRMDEMSPDEFADVQAAFAKAIEAYKPGSGAPPTPPSRFKETKISLSDIKAGDHVSVTAATDILTAASFEAVKVAVLPAGAVAAPAPAVPEANSAPVQNLETPPEDPNRPAVPPEEPRNEAPRI